MIHPAFATQQRARWMRPDAARWLRPDAAKFLKPGTDPADIYPALAHVREAQARDLDVALARERAALDGLRAELAAVKSDLAWRRFVDAVAQKYSPNQPRVPAGQTGGGQWTSGSGGGRPRVHIYRTNPDDESVGDGGRLDEIVSDGGDWANSNPGFDDAAHNFEASDSNVESIVSRPPSERLDVRINTTDWEKVEDKPIPRYDTRLASNDKKPRLGRNVAISLFVDLGRRLVQAFRSENYLFDLFNQDNGTVSYTRLDNRNIYGSNSTSPTYTRQDRETANRMREVLTKKYPQVMNTDNLGRKPNDALYHAETNVLLRSAKANGGTLTGRSIDIYVDRPLCNSCRKVIPLVALELGNPEITIADPLTVFSIVDGKITSRRSR